MIKASSTAVYLRSLKPLLKLFTGGFKRVEFCAECFQAFDWSVGINSMLLSSCLKLSTFSALSIGLEKTYSTFH